MKTWHLFEAIGLVDDRLVEEAADARRSAAPWGKWLATAACAVLLISVGTVGAGTILRGCGSGMVKSEAASDSAAPAAAEASEEVAPAAAAPEEVAPAEPSAAPMAAAPAPEPAGESVAGGAEPEAAPEEYATPNGEAAPESPAKMTEDEFGSISSVGNDGGTDAAPELRSENGNLSVSTPEVRYEETGRFARYTVENQSAGALTGTLQFSVDTDENGIEGTFLEIEVGGEAVPFTVGEAEEDNVSPETAGTRHFLVRFNVTVPANGSVEVEIKF